MSQKQLVSCGLLRNGGQVQSCVLVVHFLTSLRGVTSAVRQSTPLHTSHLVTVISLLCLLIFKVDDGFKLYVRVSNMPLGTPTNIDGHDGLVLFDLMTHTLDGNSGIGDFGREGINAFLQDHQCGEICKCLHLDEDIPLRFIEEGESETVGPANLNDRDKSDDGQRSASDTDDEDGA